MCTHADCGPVRLPLLSAPLPLTARGTLRRRGAAAAFSMWSWAQQPKAECRSTNEMEIAQDGGPHGR